MFALPCPFRRGRAQTPQKESRSPLWESRFLWYNDVFACRGNYAARSLHCVGSAIQRTRKLMKFQEKQRLREKRRTRIRSKVTGTASRPRLNVYRSTQHIYAQVIDDVQGHTLVSACSVDPALRESLKTGGNLEAAKAVGKLVAERPSLKASIPSSSTAAAISIMVACRRWRTALAKAACNFRRSFHWRR